MTQKYHRITPQWQQNLCVGTVGEKSGYWGTNLQLTACNPADPSQYWTYNRTTGRYLQPQPERLHRRHRPELGIVLSHVRRRLAM